MWNKIKNFVLGKPRNVIFESIEYMENVIISMNISLITLGIYVFQLRMYIMRFQNID